MKINAKSGRILISGLLGVIVFVIGLGGWFALNKSHPAPTQTPSSNQTATPIPGQVSFKFTELGVQIPVPDSIKDLTYSLKSGKTTEGKTIQSVNLSTQSLAQLDPNCSNAGLGTLSKVDGQYPQDSKTIANEAGLLSKQFPAFYISYSMPQSYCSKNQTAILLFRDQYTVLANALDSIQQIQ